MQALDYDKHFKDPDFGPNLAMNPYFLLGDLNEK